MRDERWFVAYQHTTTYLLVNELMYVLYPLRLRSYSGQSWGYNNNAYQVVLYPLRLRSYSGQSWGYNNNAYQVAWWKDRGPLVTLILT